MKSHYSALYGVTHAHFLAKSEQAAAASAHYVPLGVRAGICVIFAPKACDFCPNDSERIINHFAAFDTKALAFITVAF